LGIPHLSGSRNDHEATRSFVEPFRLPHLILSKARLEADRQHPRPSVIR
jgi:hypothetical protein